MGRGKKRNTAKTGDVAIYKARDDADSSTNNKKDDDMMYNEVERYHNANEDLQDDILKFDRDDDSDDDDGFEQKENVFDLGLGDDDDSDDSDDSSVDSIPKKKRAAHEDASDETPDDSDDDGESDSDGDSSVGSFEAPETDVLNWGKRKKDYYHGDTADLELGQQVEDAELEEEAGREVLKTRMEGMTENDFMLDDDDDEDNSDNDGQDDTSKSKTLSSAITTSMRKNLSKLSKKDKIKLMGKSHPELLPLITHFREEFIRPCVDETLVVANAMFQNKENAEAVGATNAGLQYLLSKALIQTSTALNVCQYLLIKAENAKSNNDTNDDDENMLVDSQDDDNIRNHPVIKRLNQLNQLGDKLQSDVESKVPGLTDQVENLAKASSLMFGDEESDGEDSENSEEEDDESKIVSSALDQIANDQEEEDDESSSSEEEEDAVQVQKNVRNEARFAVRSQDHTHLSNDEDQRSKKRRRALPAFADYGDEDGADQAILDKANKSLASTVNTITQRRKKSPSNGTAETEETENADRFERGLEMMNADLGGDDDEDQKDIDMDDGGLDDDPDGDDFYAQMKKKSKEKKEFKKNMYAVAPKYPGMDDEVHGERSVGQMIMKNRGLVAHKSKMNRNPRVKKREQYRKAIIRRKGAVREVRTEEGHKYGGEETGIRSGLSRSRKL